jgi:deoxyribodipyrimidine photo-lyase
LEKIGLLLFRNNLRLNDNLVLAKALQECDKLIYLYIFPEIYFSNLRCGHPKVGKYRMKFLFETVEDLKQNLKRNENDLVIKKGNTLKIVSQLIEKYNVSDVYLNNEICSEEVQDEADLLTIPNIKIHKVWDSTLFELNRLPFSISDLPDIFTQFRQRVEKYSLPIEPIGIPKEISQKAYNCDEISDVNRFEDLGFTDFEINPNSVLEFKGGETEALKRLEYYTFESQKLSFYKQTRNGLLGEGYSSKLSAWLANGSISARTIYNKVKQYEKEVVENESTYWLIFELIWRDYFKFVALKYGTGIFKIEGIKKISKRYSNDMAKFQSWVNGRTNEDFVNANMIELNLTGWMSNRGRQNVASYLVHDLMIDWRLGAEYFESLLLDYDPTSNWCNWQYVAGVGNDPRENRKFNIKRQQDMYDSNQKFTNKWLKSNTTQTLF